MAFAPKEIIAHRDATLDASLDTPSRAEPSVNTLSESLISKSKTGVDALLVADGLGQQGAAKEPVEGHGSVEAPGESPKSSQLLEIQLHDLQDRVESLERLEKFRMQGHLGGDNVPIILPTQDLYEGSDDEGSTLRRYRSRAEVRKLNDELEPAGIYMARTIRSYEQELGRLKRETARISRLQEEKNQLQSTVDKLERERDALRQELRKVDRLEVTTTAVTTTGSEYITSAEPTNDEGPAGGEGPTSRQLIPELNIVEWEHFSRLRNGGTDEGPFAIDVLKGEPIISLDFSFYRIWGGRYSRRPAESKASMNKLATTSQVIFPGQAPLAERIRINSEHILKILDKIHDESWPTEAPVVMTRPYKTLAYYDQHIHQKFQYLKDRFGREDIHPVETPPTGLSEMPISKYVFGNKMEDPNESEGVDVETKGGKPEDSDVDSDDDQDEFTSSLTAYKHLKCLVDFMDGDIYRKLQYLESDRCQTVTFSDIWYLFRPGLEVIEQTRRQAYRILSISSAPHKTVSPYLRWAGAGDAKVDEETPVYLHCVYIDFDGKNLGPVLCQFKIPRFEGEKDVTTLEVFPLRFAEKKGLDSKGETDDSMMPTLRQRLIARGKKFLDATTPKHMYYNGSTLDTRDEIDSHVVVDFEEAFLQAPGQTYSSTNTSSEDQIPGWMPTLNKLVGDPPEISFGDIACEARCCIGEYVHSGKSAEQKRNQQQMATLMPNDHQREPSLMIYPRPLKDVKGRDDSLSDDDFLIMTYRVFGFVLWSRKWAKLDLDHLSLPETSGKRGRNSSNNEHEGSKHSVCVPTNTVSSLENSHEVAPALEEEYDTTFRQLVLPKGHKDMVKSLIAQHFRGKESASGEYGDARQGDIVRGKGKGLIILLHGAPGVGKTSTAEGVAEMFKKPLFQIACGDLGTSASEVEKALEMHFSLANKWGCILLLDEADVFLAARSKSDFIRNGLVSVFLRVLEYYSGILFLTTNRVGDFDEAFASRIHISLYYPQLDIESTEAIFKLNLNLINDRFRLKQRSIRIEEDEILNFATSYFETHEKERWNGRQIRDACQTALALAEYHAQESSHGGAVDTTVEVVLRRGDLETVSAAYLQSITYLNKVRGKDAESWAKSTHLRALEKEIGWQKAETVPKTHVQPSEVATGPFSQSTAPIQHPTATTPLPIGAPSVVHTGPHFHPPPNYPAVYGYGPQPMYGAPVPEAPHNAPPPGWGPLWYQHQQQGPLVGGPGPPTTTR